MAKKLSIAAQKAIAKAQARLAKPVKLPTGVSYDNAECNLAYKDKRFQRNLKS